MDIPSVYCFCTQRNLHSLILKHFSFLHPNNLVKQTRGKIMFMNIIFCIISNHLSILSVFFLKPQRVPYKCILHKVQSLRQNPIDASCTCSLIRPLGIYSGVDIPLESWVIHPACLYSDWQVSHVS